MQQGAVVSAVLFPMPSCSCFSLLIQALQSAKMIWLQCLLRVTHGFWVVLLSLFGAIARSPSSLSHDAEISWFHACPQLSLSSRTQHENTFEQQKYSLYWLITIWSTNHKHWYNNFSFSITFIKLKLSGLTLVKLIRPIKTHVCQAWQLLYNQLVGSPPIKLRQAVVLMYLSHGFLSRYT